MNFETRKIRPHSPKPPPTPKPKKTSAFGNKKRLSISASIGIFLVIILSLIFGIYKAVKSIDFKFFLSAAGDELQTDAYGHTNFLILGSGGANHDGGDLTDTMIIASLDNENKLVTMISIPRDLYVQDSILGGGHKINELYYFAKKYYDDDERQGLEHLKDRIEEMIGIPLHYWVHIDFQGFVDLVDALGGVDIFVENAINDPFYPGNLPNSYQTFKIDAGQQHLDGETALKFARSRKTTSDFDRSHRQQQILFAIKEKALQTEIIFSKDKITDLLNALKENIETNIQVKEILTLGSMAGDYTKDGITQRLIHDDPNQCGGLLYPGNQEVYGSFVLIPAGGVEYIHEYTNLNFNYPYANQPVTRIHILNGTSTEGLAAETKQVLRRLCFEITGFGNALNKIPNTIYYYQGERPDALDYLQNIIPGQESTTVPQEYLAEGQLINSDLIIELGEDYMSNGHYIEDPFYNLSIWQPRSTPAASTESSEEEEEESADSEDTSTETPDSNTEAPADNTETTPEPATSIEAAPETPAE